MSENAVPMLCASAPAVLRFRIEDVFTPFTPVVRRDLFAGRAPAIQTLETVLRTAGRHAVVFGERGTGKTSLVTLLAEITGASQPVAHVSLVPGDTFGTAWSRVAEQFRLIAARGQRGLATTTIDSDVANGAPDGGAWTPESTIRLAERATATAPATVVFDDFQNMTDPAEKYAMATIMGALRTMSPTLTILVTGTARSAEALLAGTEAFAAPVHVSRLSPEECREVLVRAVRVLDLTFDDGVTARIATLSNGLPQLVHALGLAAVRAAADGGTSNVTNAHLAVAVTEVVKSAGEETVHAYDQATVRARRGIYPEILLACALAPRDAHGTYNVADVRQALQGIVRREVRGLTNQVAALTEDGRGAVVEKQGLASAARYRFVNPALEPYILMRGLEQGWATCRKPGWLPSASDGSEASVAA